MTIKMVLETRGEEHNAKLISALTNNYPAECFYREA